MRIFSFLLIFLSVHFLSAQDGSYNSLLWKIKGNGLSKPSYLYGTIHIMPKADFEVPKSLKKKMKKTDKLVMELKLDLATMMSAMQDMMLPGDQTLNDLMTDNEYQALSSFVEDSIKRNMSTFERMKPLMLSQQISTDYCMGKKIKSYEMSFNRMFKRMGKPVYGLETAREQMKYLDDISMENQVQGLLEIIEAPGEACEEFNTLLEVYQNGDLDKLLEMTTEDEEISQSLDGLLVERNHNWIPKLDKLLQSESLFIAVGAAHLPGPDGVIELLRAKGYEVSPL